MTQQRSLQEPTPTLSEDLIPLERRGALAEPERRRLVVALRASSTLRALRELGGDFDEVPLHVSGDSALLERIAARAKSHGGSASIKPSLRMRRPLALAAVVSFTLASLSAAAMVYHSSWLNMVYPPMHRGGLDDSSAPATEVSRVRKVPRVAVSQETNQALRVDVEGTRTQLKTELKREAVNPESAIISSSTLSVGSRPSAAELFSTANSARRAGDVAQAIRFYQQLVLEYPGSSEASLSHVVRGRIHLNDGNWTQALQQFDVYLRGSPGGSLAQEALDGKARSLGQLGRTVEERGVWQQLVDRYPRSIYMDTARRRISELE
jgi:tetratricopeptide (TPR) repeat protein